MKVDKSLQHFAARLRLAREARGLSQGELADAIGSDQRVISVIESGRRDIKLSTLKKIAAALRVSVEWLIKDEPVERALFAAHEERETYETNDARQSPARKKAHSGRRAKKQVASN